MVKHGWLENTLFTGGFPIETPISNGFPIATCDYRRVNHRTTRGICNGKLLTKDTCRGEMLDYDYPYAIGHQSICRMCVCVYTHDMEFDYEKDEHNPYTMFCDHGRFEGVDQIWDMMEYHQEPVLSSWVLRQVLGFSEKFGDLMMKGWGRL